MKYTKEKTKEISFPLGGIGSGSIGLAGNGALIDWEIFNRPSKGSVLGYSHFAIKAIKGGKPITYVLNGDTNESLMGQYRKSSFTGYGYGPNRSTMCGFPHFGNVEFKGEFPVAELDFSDNGFPGEVKLRAFNPFIPNDEDNSSIPAAFFEIEIKNTKAEKIRYQAALSLTSNFGVSHNESETADGCRVLFMKHGGVGEDDAEYGDLCIATDCEKSFVQNYWYRGGWSDGVTSFWKDFNSSEDLPPRNYEKDGAYDTGTVAAEAELLPGESRRIRFVLSWNMPNNYNYWEKCKEGEKPQTWKNYYAVLFKNSAESAKYALKNWESLRERTMRFCDALYSTTIPAPIREAAAANLSVLKSPTVLRLEDGSFYGWEGVHETTGSCQGTCQHVWNYAYAMCFLFPRLERSIRNLEFEQCTYHDGKMGFRMLLPVGRGAWDFRACTDGQMGAVIKTYREWKLSGDNEWLKKYWDKLKSIMGYAWSNKNPDKWDADHDGVLEGRQHHTLDMELFCPSSWLEGMYLAALAAMAEMAEFLEDAEAAKEYRELFLNGQKWTKENLFNGKYFIQKIDIKDRSIIDEYKKGEVCSNAEDEMRGIENYWNSETEEIKYQIADGSEIDQLLGQWHADILGLGDVFDPHQVQTALSEMMKNNYKDNMRAVTNMWRVFSLNDEAGSIICDYPEGAKKPSIPIPYCEETMTGFEHAFAGLLLSRGKYSDGERVIKAVRDRFDGKKRNPWNEFECGSNYARSMASFATIPILSGFEFDLPRGRIGFNPYVKDNFKTIWSVDGAWGEFELSCGCAEVRIAEGEIELSSFGAKFAESVSELRIDGKTVAFEYDDGVVRFDKIRIKKSLTVLY